jgi:hypothetical protein
VKRGLVGVGAKAVTATVISILRVVVGPGLWIGILDFIRRWHRKMTVTVTVREPRALAEHDVVRTGSTHNCLFLE